jgi:DNA-directed RNA polymerase subunit RPC12/RpoP
MTREERDELIETLAQEPYGDCVSREAVEDAIAEMIVNGESLGYAVAYDILSDLPSVYPKQRTGHWIEDTNGTYTDNHDTWECSECGHAQILLEGTPKDNDYNYCPNCGAKMEEEE